MTEVWTVNREHRLDLVGRHGGSVLVVTDRAGNEQEFLLSHEAAEALLECDCDDEDD